MSITWAPKTEETKLKPIFERAASPRRHHQMLVSSNRAAHEHRQKRQQHHPKVPQSSPKTFMAWAEKPKETNIKSHIRVSHRLTNISQTYYKPADNIAKQDSRTFQHVPPTPLHIQWRNAPCTSRGHLCTSRGGTWKNLARNKILPKQDNRLIAKNEA